MTALEQPVTAQSEPIYCIGCDALLAPLDEGVPQAEAGPLYGLVLYTHGGYGSSHFDPCDGATRLELYLCDACTVAKASRIWYVTPGPFSKDNSYQRFDRRLVPRGVEGGAEPQKTEVPP